HEMSPGVHPGATLPAIALPRLVTRFAGPWHRMEFPKLRAGSRIVRAGIAWKTERRRISHVGADHHDVFVNRCRGVIRHDHIDFAVFAESGFDVAVSRIQRDELAAERHDDAGWT